MRYDASHKAETRKKVVKAAAAALRAKGPDGVGVADIMAEVGLTHGGFYAHFPSKAALLAAALDEAFGQSRRRYDRMGDGASKAQQLAQFIDAYRHVLQRLLALFGGDDQFFDLEAVIGRGLAGRSRRGDRGDRDGGSAQGQPGPQTRSVRRRHHYPSQGGGVSITRLGRLRDAHR